MPNKANIIRALELRIVQLVTEDRKRLADLYGWQELDKAIEALIFACPECNAGGHTCPGDGNHIPHGATDCGEHDDAPAPVAPALIWVPRTWADVRPGDDVRLPGTDNVAHVQHAVHLRWHVDPRTGTAGWNPPQALEWSGVHVILRTSTHPDQPADLTMDPAKAVEIHLTQSEVDALDALDAGGLAGWRNRAGLVEVTPDISDRDV